MRKGLFVLNSESYDLIYGPEERSKIKKLVSIDTPPQTNETIRSNSALLEDVNVIFSGWGCPVFDKELLQAAPNLQAVFYGAGSIKHIVTVEFWQRDILITSAYEANALPVAEYTISQILFCLKRGWDYALSCKKEGRWVTKTEVPGAYGSTVGIISLGMVGRRVCQLLQNFDLHIIAYDPYATQREAARLGVRLCSLEDVFENSDVVSLHTPWLKETEGMIMGEHFRRMKPYATFINTARGAVVREREMIDALEKRPDIQAVLDVTYPEPPKENSPLFTLPNIILTPHIAGSMGRECRRMGKFMVDELERYIKGEPLRWAISKEKAATLA